MRGHRWVCSAGMGGGGCGMPGTSALLCCALGCPGAVVGGEGEEQEGCLLFMEFFRRL